MAPRDVFYWTVALAMLPLAFPASSFACRCLDDIGPAAAYRYADVVVQGQVRNVRGDMNSREGATASVVVTKSWKKPIGGEIEVLTSTSCAFNFQAGEEYLLYLRISPNNAQYTTRRCIGNKLIAGAGKSLDWLERHGTPIPVQRSAP